MTKRTLRTQASAISILALLIAGAPGACTKTPTPDEPFDQPTASGSAGTVAAGGGGTRPPGDGAGGGGSAEPPLVECGSAPISEVPFSKAALRQAAADCAGWHYCRFENAAAELAARVSSHADTRSDASLAQAREAFREAMETWSQAELFQFGPLASAARAAGKDEYAGQGIRDLVYSWRSTARCRVEEQVAEQGFLNGMDGVLISGRGLYALEYLLFYPGSDTACAAATPTARAWPSFGAEELLNRKLTYAVSVADDVLAQVQALRGAWDPAGGNFMETFVSAGAPYPSEQELMTTLGWALLYAEKELKDWKLGQRIGRIEGDFVPEVPFASATAGFEELATENIRRNLRGFRALFQGCGPEGEGLGFDDWLVEAGHADFSNEIIGAWQNAQNAADASPPLETADAADVDALYESLRVLTTLLKSELFGAASPLGLKLPVSVGSDTD